MKVIKKFIFLAFIFVLSYAAFPQTTHIVQVSNFVFTPANLTIAKGDTVTWVWENGVHTTTSDSTTGVDVWNANIDQSHPTFSFVFSSPGVHHYYCIYHVGIGMKGTITVVQPTAVAVSRQLPANFILEQNYPNPANPSTIINYSLPYGRFITLDVYNTLGIEIKSLVKGYKSAGNHSVIFNADDVPSGVYLYTLRAGKFSKTRKLLVLK